MSLKFQKFVEDRNYAVAKAIYIAVIAGLLLSLFLVAKTVSEVVDWKKDSDEFVGGSITVTGEGEAVAVPDVARFNFSVNMTRDSVAEAQDASADVMNAALAFLKDNGVEESDTKTISYNAYPQYDYTPCFQNYCEQERVLRGYEVSQTVEVTVRDTENAGNLLSGIGATGVTNVSGLSFEIDDPAKLQAQARSAAIKDAKQKAKRLAKDLDVDLEEVISFSEDGGDYYPYYAERSMMDSAEGLGGAVAPKLPTGENTVSSRVYITYEID